jgi:hypothetical protein
MNIISNVYEKSLKFDQPYIEDVFNFSRYYCLNDVAQLFISFKNIQDSSQISNIRIFVNNRGLRKLDVQKFIEAVPVKQESFIKFLESYFGNEEFFIFINNAGLWSEKILSTSAQLCKGFIESFPKNSLSIEHHIVIGRYSKTPFGVHLDDAVDRVFHINLGPGSKSFSLWDKNDYVAATGSIHFIDDYAEISHLASNHEFGAGQGFLLPARFYHVASSINEISVGVALAFTKKTAELVSNQIYAEFKKVAAQVNLKDISYDNFELSDINKLLVRAFDECADIRKTSLFDLVEMATLRSWSNMCFVEKNELDYSQLRGVNGRFSIKKPFSVEQYRDKRGCNFFARGHGLLIKDSVTVQRIEKLLSDESFDLCIDSENDIHSLDGIDKFKIWLVASRVVEESNV